MQHEGGSVAVVEKDDVRKAGGVYYTPQYIVSYMAEQSLQPMVEGKSFETITKLRIIDTSCGSGSFLIGVYEYLMDACLRALSIEPGRARDLLETRDGDLCLSMKAKRRILTKCIFGVDIDSQAVEVAQLSLYLKLLGDETTHSARHSQLEMGAALLPSLNENIVEGNSLVTLQGQLYSVEEAARVKSLDFHAAFAGVFRSSGGFDLVIGNPPYIKEYTNRSAFDYVRGSPYFEGKMDIWYMFACRGLDWLRSGGRLAFIATNNWVSNAGSKILRSKVAREAQIEQLIDFGNYKVFQDAGIQTMILIARKDGRLTKYKFDYRRLSTPRPTLKHAQDLLAKVEGAGLQYLDATFDRRSMGQSTFSFSEDAVAKLLDKISGAANFQFEGKREIAQGIVPNIDVVTRRGINLIPLEERNKRGVQVGDGVFVVDARQFGAPTPAEERFLKPTYDPSQVARYAIVQPATKRLIYSKPDLTREGLPPRLKAHLDRFAEIMAARRENQTGRIETFHLHWPRDERFFAAGPKILAVRKCAVPTFAYTEDEAYVMMAFNVIKTDRANMLYLTGLLNSAVIRFWLKHRGKLQGDHYQIDKEPLLELPLHLPPVAVQNVIGQQVETVIRLTKLAAHATTSAEAERIGRLLREAEYKVEQSIADIYELSPDDWAAVSRA